MACNNKTWLCLNVYGLTESWLHTGLNQAALLISVALALTPPGWPGKAVLRWLCSPCSLLYSWDEQTAVPITRACLLGNGESARGQAETHKVSKAYIGTTSAVFYWPKPTDWTESTIQGTCVNKAQANPIGRSRSLRQVKVELWPESKINITTCQRPRETKRGMTKAAQSRVPVCPVDTVLMAQPLL